MKTILKLSAFSILTFLGSTAAHASSFDKIPSRSGDHCMDQAMSNLEYMFGEGVEAKRIFSDSAGEKVAYWLKTNVCEGHIVVSFVRSAACGSAHYGSVPMYIQRIHSVGACKALIQGDIFPTFESTFAA